MNKIVYNKDAYSSELIDNNFLDNFEVSGSNLERIWKYFESHLLEGQDKDGNAYEITKEDLAYCGESEKFHINDNLLVSSVEQFGGEGEGDSYWFVYSVTDKRDNSKRYFKWDGYYASYDGGYYDDHFEVFPKEVVKIEWKKKA